MINLPRRAELFGPPANTARSWRLAAIQTARSDFPLRTALLQPSLTRTQKRGSRILPQLDLMLAKGTPSKPLTQGKAVNVLKQHAPAIAPNQRCNLPVGSENESSAPAMSATKPASPSGWVLSSGQFGQRPTGLTQVFPRHGGFGFSGIIRERGNRAGLPEKLDAEVLRRGRAASVTGSPKCTAGAQEPLSTYSWLPVNLEGRYALSAKPEEHARLRQPAQPLPKLKPGSPHFIPVFRPYTFGQCVQRRPKGRSIKAMTPKRIHDFVVKLVKAEFGHGVGQRGLYRLGTQGLPGAGRRDNRTDEDHVLTTWTSVPPVVRRKARCGHPGSPASPTSPASGAGAVTSAVNKVNIHFVYGTRVPPRCPGACVGDIVIPALDSHGQSHGCQRDEGHEFHEHVDLQGHRRPEGG